MSCDPSQLGASVRLAGHVADLLEDSEGCFAISLSLLELVVAVGHSTSCEVQPTALDARGVPQGHEARVNLTSRVCELAPSRRRVCDLPVESSQDIAAKTSRTAS